jgi:hypothetical protein
LTIKRHHNKVKDENNKVENGNDDDNSRSEVTRKLNNRLIVSIFIFFFFINVLTSGGHLDWWDGNEAFFVTESMVLRHSAKLHPDVPTLKKIPFDIAYTVYSNKFIQGNSSIKKETITLEPVYTLRSLFLSAVGVPFYYLALAISASPLAVIGLFVNSMLIAFTCVIVFCFSHEVYGKRWISFALSLIFGVCSFVWPYHTSFWVQPLQGLTLISATYFLYKGIQYHKYFNLHHQDDSPIVQPVWNRATYFSLLGGFLLGLSIFAHPTSIIFVPGFIVYIIFSIRQEGKRTIIFFLIALFATLFFAGLINFIRFGSFVEFGYGYYGSIGTHNGWAGLIGLLFSPGAGLIYFFPISILVVVAAKYMYYNNRGLLLICSYIIIANWLFVGTLSFGLEPFAWSGAIAWGPRYFVPIIPFITLILGALLLEISEVKNRRRKLIIKTSVIALAALGFYVNLVGTLVWYQYGIIYGWEREQLHKFTNNMDIMTWNPYYSPIVLHTKALLEDFVSTIHPDKYLNTAWYWTSYGLAPCSYDIYILCSFGLLAFVGISIFIAAIGVYILKQVRADDRRNHKCIKRS